MAIGKTPSKRQRTKPTASRKAASRTSLPKKLRTGKDGRIFWARIPGFLQWFRERGKALCTADMVSEIEDRFGIATTPTAVAGLRQKMGVFSEAPVLAANGRVAWDRIPGLLEWFHKHGPNLTRHEAIAQIAEKFNLEMTCPAIDSARRSHGVPMTAETRRRALLSRGEESRAKEPELSPIEKMERAIVQRQVREHSARATFYELVGEKMLRAVADLPKLPPVEPFKSGPIDRDMSEEEAVLLISDVQAGLRVDAHESGGLGAFNYETLFRYMDNLRDAVTRIIRYHPNVRKLHVPFIGDIIDGSTIYPGHLRQIEDHAVGQSLMCVQRFDRFTRYLASIFKEVHCYGVIGNHGRIGMKGEQSPLNNFDYLVYRMLEKWAENQKNITWHISESWWQLTEINGWRFLFVHGDDTGQSWAGIPFYAVGRHKAKYRELFKTATQVSPDKSFPDFDYMAIGHHSEAAQFWNVFMNGSWPGGTEFSIKKLQASGVPSQKFFAVSKRWGVTWVRDINLRPIRPIQTQGLPLR